MFGKVLGRFWDVSRTFRGRFGAYFSLFSKVFGEVLGRFLEVNNMYKPVIMGYSNLSKQ